LKSLSRASALAAILALALIPASAQSPRVADLAVHRIEIHAQAIENFDPREPRKTRFGALSFRGGLVLESTYKDFGGLSGLRVSADGAHFLSLTDKGNWLRARIVYRGTTPIAITDAEMAPILGPDGRPLRSRGWYDTEALAVDGDFAYVGIERVQQVVRFDIGHDGLRARGQPVAMPAGVKLLPSNQSIECVEVAPKDGPLGGAVIAISEHGLDTGGNLMAFIAASADRPGGGVFSLKRTDEFDVSDCAATPDGRLLVLERRFSWIRGLAMRIRAVPFAAIKPGALVDGPELIFADTGFQIDNMEGLSVHREPSGVLVLTIISDDNFSPLQRTVLLQFALEQ
jgi:hypothetical protein